MKRYGSVLSIFLLCTLAVFPQNRGDDVAVLSITPGMSIPLGSDSDIFGLSWGAGLRGVFPIPLGETVSLRPGVRLGYRYSPTTLDSSISAISGAGEAGVQWRFHPRFSAEAFGGLGYFYSFYNNPDAVPTEPKGGGGMYAFAGAGLSFHFSDRFSMGLTSGWQGDFSYRNSITVGLEGAWHLPRQAKDEEGNPLVLELVSADLEPIYPFQYTWYESHPIGTVELVNAGTRPVEDLSVSFTIENFMGDPAALEAPPGVEPGESSRIDLRGLLSLDVFHITESTRANGRMITEYTVAGKRGRREFPLIFEIRNRNALTWTDDRKAAAFVTVKDPAVLAFSKAAAGVVRSEGRKFPEPNSLYALGMYEVLRLYGVHYVVDPASAYQEMSVDAGAVDYLQFPRQTLQYRAGDCDDLTVLFCALLESVNIETAFITVPGHIFAAYAVHPGGKKPASLHTVDAAGRTWIPVELTARAEGFPRAVEIAAALLQGAGDKAVLYPVRDAWSEYPPVGLPEQPMPLDVPDDHEIRKAINETLETIIDREISKGKLEIESKYGKNGPLVENAVGVLYARYGYPDDAEHRFLAALENGYTKARINLGNLAILAGDWSGALDWYNSVENRDAGKPPVLLGISRANYELGNYTEAGEFHTRLALVSPELAMKYSWLSGGAAGTLRAGQGDETGGVEWVEE